MIFLLKVYLASILVIGVLLGSFFHDIKDRYNRRTIIVFWVLGTLFWPIIVLSFAVTEGTDALENRLKDRTVIRVADFCQLPMYRTPQDCEGSELSGQELRRKIEEELEKGYNVVVEFGGTRGYTSAFLDEAFRDLPKERVKVRDTKDPSCLIECRDYMK